MVEIDLEGKANSEKTEYKKFLIERTLTTGKIIEVNSWTGKNKGKDIEKIILSIMPKDKPEININCWMTANIKKGSDPAYNTLAYDNLEALGLLEEFSKVKEELMKKEDKLKALEDFFYTKLIDKNIKFVPETIISEDGQKYSIVKKIEGFT
jgi:hypothetical protein